MHVFALQGDVDFSNYLNVRHDLLQCAEGDNLLLVDCARLTFLDCAGISAIIGARNELQGRGGEVYLTNLPPFHMNMLLKLDLGTLIYSKSNQESTQQRVW